MSGKKKPGVLGESYLIPVYKNVGDVKSMGILEVLKWWVMKV